MQKGKSANLASHTAAGQRAASPYIAATVVISLVAVFLGIRILEARQPVTPAQWYVYLSVREPLGLICHSFPDVKATRLYTDATNGFICTDWTGNVAGNRLGRTSSSIEIYKGRHKVRTISFSEENESLAGWTSDGLLYSVGREVRILDIHSGVSQPAPKLSGIYRTAATEKWWTGASLITEGVSISVFRKGKHTAEYVWSLNDVNGGVGDFTILKDRYVALTVDMGWKTKQSPDKRLLLLDSVTGKQIAVRKVDGVDIAPTYGNKDLFIARQERKGQTTTLHVNRLNVPSLKETTVGSLATMPNVTFYGISPDERLVYLLEYPEHGPGVIHVKDLQTGRAVYSRKEVDQIVTAQVSR